jgi:(1->4)-alpha-D-glucan 1-alpha-D-glucosylmutase
MRLSHYLVKAAREAGRHTDWLQADPVYERALTGFVRDLLADPAYRSDFAPLQQRIASFASRTSLAQAVLRVAAPGVPDLYQGADLWDLSLVDPDNRRPVDFARRRSMLRDLDERAARDPAGLARELLARWPDGAIKLYVTACALRTRRRHADLFRDGDYRPVSVVGEHQAHVFAFLRRLAGDAVLVVIPRLLLRLASSLPGGDRGLPPAPRLWGSTALVLPADAPVQWRDAITGRTWQADGHQLGLAQLFSDLPVFLGEREESAAGCR